jgi:hypothetical protein
MLSEAKHLGLFACVQMSAWKQSEILRFTQNDKGCSPISTLQGFNEMIVKTLGRDIILPRCDS